MAHGEVLMAFNPLVIAAGLQLAGSLLGGKKSGDDQSSSVPRPPSADDEIERLRRKLLMLHLGLPDRTGGGRVF